jgi:TAG lipase/steryl ester hydrolase/phospholipase A2/LPA acyltransferase
MTLAPPDPPIASTATPTFLRLERGSLRQKLAEATNYAQWIDAAQAFDAVTGRERWKQRQRSGLYDHAMIAEKLDRLLTLLRQGDSRGLMFEIEEGVHGNLGGMGKPILHNKAQFGTKQLITDYVAAVAETLMHLEAVDDPQIPVATKLDLFRRASHCYGRTALMMSSGGMLMFFHFGVAKSLFEQDVLPNVISGSSAGAIVAAVLGTRTDAELQGFFKPENLYFGEAWSPNRLEQLTGLRRIFGTDSFERTFDRLIPDLTFREAFERSGRNISISVSPCERHQTPRLLNAVTSPHVLIRSAVRASCAVPGLFEPVQLLARDQNGQTVPFLKSRWIDGVFAADLPAKQLARLYGTNHYIVSYVNPLLLLTFRDHKTQGYGLKPIVDLMKGNGAQHAQGRGSADRQVRAGVVGRRRAQGRARHPVAGLCRRHQHHAAPPPVLAAATGIAVHAQGNRRADARRRAPDLAAHRDDPHLLADQPHAGWNPGARRSIRPPVNSVPRSPGETRGFPHRSSGGPGFHPGYGMSGRLLHPGFRRRRILHRTVVHRSASQIQAFQHVVLPEIPWLLRALLGEHRRSALHVPRRQIQQRQFGHRVVLHPRRRLLRAATIHVIDQARHPACDQIRTQGPRSVGVADARRHVGYAAEHHALCS